MTTSGTPSASRLRLLLAWLPAQLYIALIWWLSSQQITLPLHLFPMRDKLVHFVEYGVLSACFAHAVRVTWPGQGFRGLIVAVWLTAGAGFVDELHQAFVPGRMGDVWDLAADALGALVFASALWLFHAFREGRPGAPAS